MYVIYSPDFCGSSTRLLLGLVIASASVGMIGPWDIRLCPGQLRVDNHRYIYIICAALTNLRILLLLAVSTGGFVQYFCW